MKLKEILIYLIGVSCGAALGALSLDKIEKILVIAFHLVACVMISKIQLRG